MVRLATWNVNSVGARLERLTAWLRSESPDVVCLQETKVTQDAFPAAECSELGYETAAHGDGRWNGVAILSRIGLQDVARGFAGEPGFPAPESRAIAATCGPLRVWSVYVPNGRALDDPHLAYKLEWLRGLAVALRREIAATDGLCACGDFNVAPTDADVWDPAVFEGSTHVSTAEREALAGVLDVGLRDVPPRALKGEPFTYWDYRSGSFHKGHGMRIDLVLADATAAAAVTDAYIDREARKGPRPSDHAPVVVDLDL
jgi:exodeoxyribonuclease-3